MKSIIIWILLGLILTGSFLIRVLPNYNLIFQPSMVVFNEVDPWYHMRLVDYMVTNFPSPLLWDQFATLGGARVGYLPIIAWTVAGTSLLTGIDYNIIGALLPPLAACLCLIIIFLIGLTLFRSAWVGLGAALIASILPSQFLQRSVLGNTDHHILEALFLFLTTLFILKFSENYKIRYSILAGLSFSLYFMNWWGSLMMLVPLAAWILFTSLKIYFLNLKSIKFHLGSLLLILSTFLPLLLIKDLLPDTSLFLYSFLGLVGLTILLGIIAYLPKSFYIVVLTLTFSIIAVLTYNIGLLKNILDLSKYALGSFISTIGEAAPMDLYTYFNIYNVAAFLVIPGLYFYTKNRNYSFFLILTLFLFTLSIFQIRWSYYLIISIAIICSYFLYWISQQVSKNFRAPIYTIAILMLLIPSIKGNIQMIKDPPLLTPAWEEALIWLNISTNPPYEDPKAYLKPNPGEPSYTVSSWWDYGHWIIRIGRRVPLTSPTIQVIKDNSDSQFFTAQNPEDAKIYLKGLKVKYVIIDEAMVTGKFYAIVVRQGYDIKDVSKWYQKSMLVQLYKKGVDGYKLVYDNGDIKIFEVLDYEKVSLGL